MTENERFNENNDKKYAQLEAAIQEMLKVVKQ